MCRRRYTIPKIHLASKAKQPTKMATKGMKLKHMKLNQIEAKAKEQKKAPPPPPPTTTTTTTTTITATTIPTENEDLANVTTLNRNERTSERMNENEVKKKSV